MSLFCLWFPGADPYFTIECEGEKVRSHTVNNNLNPEWDASATFYRKNSHSDILIEVRIMSLETMFQYECDL